MTTRHEGASALDKTLMVHAMMLTSYIDGELHLEELAYIKVYARTLPEFKGEPFERYYQEAKRLAAESNNSVDAAVERLREIQDERLRRKTYVCMVELALASGMVPAEERLLANAADVLRIDAAMAAQNREVLAIKFA